jgi:outer membrane protein
MSRLRKLQIFIGNFYAKGDKEMPLLRLNFASQRIVGITLAAALSLNGWAQNAQPAPSALPQAPQPMPTPAPQAQQYVPVDYSKPRSQFPNVIAPYKPGYVPPPNLNNTDRIQLLMHDGKIMLSMNDAVALALENNLDLVLARYNLNIADTDILRADAGANILGVNTGIVQNTPGGGVGGLSGTVGSGTGGTSIAAGGAGTGTNGLVGSTLGIGSPITSFDPVISGTLQMDRDFTQSTSVFSPVPIANTNTGTANFSYLQGFHWGTNFAVGFNNTHVTTNNPTSTYTPSIGSGLQFRLTQTLLQGFGFLPNTRFIRIAKNNREISDVAFRLQIITTVDQIENLYWDLVFAYENVRVQEEALTFADRTLADTRKQLQFGTVPPIQVVSAQSTVSTDQQALILAQTNLELQELLMKNALSRNLDDPTLAGADVIPTSTMQLPEQEPVVPTQDLVSDALGHRAELAESRVDLSTRELNIKAVRNAMLPTLDLFAYYGGSGIGGDVNSALLPPACTSANSALQKCFNPAQAAPPFRNGGPVGYASTLNQLVTGTAPDKGIGLTLTIPIRNRQAQADQVRAELEYRQAQVRLQQLGNQVRIEVRNAQFALRQNRASVQAAQAAADFARQTLNAEQQKLAVGVSNSTAVLQDQASLTSAESNLVSAKAAYEKARVELDRATGLLLDHSGIVMADAERGQVTHMPNVPYIAPSSDVPPGAASQPQPLGY